MYRCTRCVRVIFTAHDADLHEHETSHYVDFIETGEAEDVL